MSDKLPPQPTAEPEDSKKIANPEQLEQLQRILQIKKQKDLEQAEKDEASWNPPPPTKEDSEKTAEVLKAEEPPLPTLEEEGTQIVLNPNEVKSALSLKDKAKIFLGKFRK